MLACVLQMKQLAKAQCSPKEEQIFFSHYDNIYLTGNCIANQQNHLRDCFLQKRIL